MELDRVSEEEIISINPKMRFLPDDVLLEIFRRLPDKPLVRLKSLSKTWYFLISQICISHPRLRTAPVVGLFVRMHKVIYEHKQYIVRTKNHPTLYHLSSNSMPEKFSRKMELCCFATLKEKSEGEGDEREQLLGWEECFSSYGLPFRPDPDDLIGCCNGLLLFVNTDTFQYYVCNPLTRQCVSIPQRPRTQQELQSPPPQWNKDKSLYAALVLDPSQSTCYKVVRIEWIRRRTNVGLDIYSSADRSWSRHSLEVDPCIRDGLWVRPATYFDGSLFRLSSSWHIIQFDLQEISISYTDLPLSFRECNGLMGCVGVLNHQLCYSNEYCNMVHIWLLENCHDDAARWKLKHVINIYDLTCDLVLHRECGPPNSKWVEPMAFNPSANVVYMGSPLVILSYNLENNKLVELVRVEKDVVYPGCYCPALTYVRFLAPFTAAGDICDPNFLQNAQIRDDDLQICWNSPR